MKLNPIAPPSTKKLIAHPYSKLMPEMTSEEFNDLATDIGKNGVLNPIVIYQGKILDGVHRYRILEAYEFKKGMSFVEFDGTDAEAKTFIISANIHRRHLTPEKRRELIASLLRADPTQSNRQIAATAKVDDKTVGVVREKLEATAEIPQLEETTGADGKTRKCRQGANGGGNATTQKEKIEFLKVVDAKTATNAYHVFESHLLEALEEVKKRSSWNHADEYAQATTKKLQEKLLELIDKVEEKADDKADDKVAA